MVKNIGRPAGDWVIGKKMMSVGLRLPVELYLDYKDLCKVEKFGISEGIARLIEDLLSRPDFGGD